MAPGPPIAADPDVAVRSMPEECDALLAALTTFQACPNLDADDKDDLAAWIETVNLSIAAGGKAKPDANALRTMALGCYHARISVEAGTQRCAAGPRPKDR